MLYTIIDVRIYIKTYLKDQDINKNTNPEVYPLNIN